MPAVITETEARTRISAGCSATDWPALSSDQLNLCVTLSKRRDAAGYAPNETSWTPTFDPAAGIYYGWLMKAGAAAAKYDVDASAQQSFKRSQVAKSCQEQAQLWASAMEAIVEQFYTYEDLNVNTRDYDPAFDLSTVRLI